MEKWCDVLVFFNCCVKQGHVPMLCTSPFEWLHIFCSLDVMIDMWHVKYLFSNNQRFPLENLENGC